MFGALASRSLSLHDSTVSAQDDATEKRMAYVKVLQDPYASLSIEDVSDHIEPVETSVNQKQAYFSLLQNPCAYDAVFGELDSEANVIPPTARLRQEQVKGASGHIVGKTHIAKELDTVLRLYKPYVARNEWPRVVEYTSVFLEKATRPGLYPERVIGRLRELRFSLMPNEKVEYNRAPAQRIISELEKVIC
jgi:hypothetical protein